jgi:hypothetical protein
MSMNRIQWALSVGTLAAALVSGAAVGGTITGGVAFPGDSIPALTVVAVPEGGGGHFTVETRAGQRSYRLEVPEGRYIVFAIPHGAGVEDEPGQAPMRGAYSAFSECVLDHPDKAAEGQCEDHSLRVVEVGAKQTRKRVDLYDWYLPEQEKARLLAVTPGASATSR